MSTPQLPSTRGAKSQRVLSCELCKSRKVKCDRKFPCSNCVKASLRCIPAALNPRPRRKRFPESKLLERIRLYEHLLRQNNISFNPLHGHPSHNSPTPVNAENSSNQETQVKSEPDKYHSAWRANSQNSGDFDDGSDDEEHDDEPNDYDCDDDVEHPRHTVSVIHDDLRRAWDQLYESNDHFLFGLRKTDVDLSTLHPQQVHIFRLWQIYLENINPLLKVTHTPTLQAHIVDAATDLSTIGPPLEALMFSIYCVSILSLTDDECCAFFGTARSHLLTSYQWACQQALLNCGILFTEERDSLTALYLYLISIRPDTDPRSLSSMLGVTIRIAQRMGMHSETSNAEHNALEAEMRRRLWWSLVIFDSRIAEMSVSKTSMLTPAWNCRLPQSINDFEIQPDMKTPPAGQGNASEAIFAVVRAELGEFVRYSPFHLDLINPALKSVAKDMQNSRFSEDRDLLTLEKSLDERYLNFCNLENPLHFMVKWLTRGYIAKYRLTQHHAKFSKPSMQQADAYHETALASALTMLDSDTQLMSSPFIKGWLWFLHFQFPFPAYLHSVHDLRRRPLGEHADRIWAVMSDNYQARMMKPVGQQDNPFFKIFSKMILQAWAAREAASGQSSRPDVEPPIVADIKSKMTEPISPPDSSASGMEWLNGIKNYHVDATQTSVPLPTDIGGGSLIYSVENQAPIDPIPNAFSTLPDDLNQLDWASVDLNFLYRHA